MSKTPHVIPAGPDRRTFLQIAGAMTGAFAFTGAQGAFAQGASGGTLRVVIEPEPAVLLSVLSPQTSQLVTSAQTNEGLLTYDFELNPMPGLAERWEVSQDGRTVTFNLRPGVKWSDGADFTSEDVAFSVGVLKENHPRGRATFANVESIDTPDATTVVLNLSAPAPYMMYALAAGESPILPKHVFEGTDIASNPAMSAPVGTGPWMLKEWVRGSHIIYERNPNYWDAPKPYIDQLIFQFARDASARSIAIETGTVDVVSGTPLPIPFTDLPRLEASEDLTIISDGWQYTNSIGRLEFNLDTEIFSNKLVRKAFAHAIDRELLLEVACYGRGRVAWGPVGPDLARFYVPELKDLVPQHDPAAAEALLDEAGYPRGADGVRFHVNMDFMPNGDLFRRGAEFIKQAMQPLGVEITVRSQDVATYVKRIYTDRDFDCAVESMNNTYDPTVGVQRLYWSKNFRPGVPYSNGSNYNNPEVDALFEAAAVEPDEARRIELFTEVQKLIIEDLPDISLFTQYSATITRAQVKDLILTADGITGTLASVRIEG